MKQEMWSQVPATKTRHTLTVLVSWLGADAPLLESDIRALVDNRPLQFSGRRVTQFLGPADLRHRDSDTRVSRDHQAGLQAAALSSDRGQSAVLGQGHMRDPRTDRRAPWRGRPEG